MRKKIPLIGGIINLIESLKGDIGIIENTDVATHSIPAGSYVIWHNELYKASSAIAVDDALSSSNLTAVSGGAANELNDKITQMDWNALSASDVVTLPNVYSAYTVPADGYILSQSYIGVELSNGNYHEFGSSGGALFVKKGMKVRKAGNSNTYDMKFFPVISKS